MFAWRYIFFLKAACSVLYIIYKTLGSLTRFIFEVLLILPDSEDGLFWTRDERDNIKYTHILGRKVMHLTIAISKLVCFSVLIFHTYIHSNTEIRVLFEEERTNLIRKRENRFSTFSNLQAVSKTFPDYFYAYENHAWFHGIISTIFVFGSVA